MRAIRVDRFGGPEVLHLAEIPDPEPGPIPSRAELADKIIGSLAVGRVSPLIGQTFPLRRAAEAHRTIAAREAIAKTLLVD